MSRAWSLARALAAFADTLRAEGVTVSPAETADALKALEVIGATGRRRFATTLRACMAKTPEDRARFDAVFARFWAAAPADLAHAVDSENLPAGDDDRSVQGVGESTPVPGIDNDTTAATQTGPQRGASAGRGRMQVDMATVDAEEQAAIEALIRALGHRLARRIARRWRARHRGRLDLRRSMRAATRRGGELLEFKRRYRPRQRPRLVVFADVSYSMDAYSRFFLCFVHAFGQCFRSVERFVFATELTRVTETLDRHAIETALSALPGAVNDWAGGTRIASSLETYLARHADRQLDSNTVVMIVSDGWDSDSPARLAAALAHLRSRCAAIVWLDPLLGHPRYFSTALGVQHESASVDLCAPARNLEQLEALVERLSQARLV